MLTNYLFHLVMFNWTTDASSLQKICKSSTSIASLKRTFKSGNKKCKALVINGLQQRIRYVLCLSFATCEHTVHWKYTCKITTTQLPEGKIYFC